MHNSKLLNGSLIDRNHMHIILKSDSGFNLPLRSPQGDVFLSERCGIRYTIVLSCSSCLGTTLKCDEFLVTVSDPLLAVIIEHFVSFTTKGLGLYGVLRLFCLCCFMSTTSPGLIFLS